MKAFLLAAGLGKRLFPLTVAKPKCLIEVGGKSLLLWNIEKLKASGIKDLVINLFHEGHQIENFFGDGSDFGVRIKYVSEKELLGTGGGVGNALTIIGNEPFILLSSDVWTDFNFSDLSLDSGILAHLVLVENPEDNPEGDMFLEGNKVNTEGRGKNLTFSGLALIDPKLFEEDKLENYELWKEVLLPASQKGLVTGELFCGDLININVQEDIERLDAYLAEE
ncbi:MAG: NTP transferase domain-containing protein [SAR86 cluster bacterium]|jgi:MurNAc alpha-1-phosphate uridylyltransferase|uniref:nucleotidyltransferase family protein n=1 Tax=Gracilimonas sp. TaxID=1974203 RepID=UPI003752F8DB|nr:NTP transferase domain-containing protein [SAR86 cluster bacterium]MCH2450709.1 NTP transferase domain-containing protein [Gracilimonas sp.]